MGLWWKHVAELPPDGFGIVIPGDPNQRFTKRIPIIWRFVWKEVVLTTPSAAGKRKSEPFFLYFESDQTRMCYRRVITNPCVVARVGPGDVRFLAMTEAGDEIDLVAFHGAEADALKHGCLRV